MAELDRDPEALQRADSGTPEVVRYVMTGHVEVPTLVDGLGLRTVGRQRLQQEELDLRMGVEREPTLRRLGEGPPQHVARVGPGR
jgi:hypothetical protein